MTMPHPRQVVAGFGRLRDSSVAHWLPSAWHDGVSQLHRRCGHCPLGTRASLRSRRSISACEELRFPRTFEVITPHHTCSITRPGIRAKITWLPDSVSACASSEMDAFTLFRIHARRQNSLNNPMVTHCIPRPNQTLERTAARRPFTFQTIGAFSVRATPALGGGRSACSR